jgi:curved DNA-binding protein CbpA
MSDFKKDYYKILDIVASASADEIKLAYRKQAKKYHPDLHPNNPEYGDLIKEVNEAYEVLGSKDERFAYDQYQTYKKEYQQKSNEPINKNKRTYTKTQTTYTEERTYIKGKIFIKYYGNHNEKEAENILREIDYKITPTEINAIIETIYKNNLTKEFKDVFARNKPIKLNIKQPISCQFINSQNDLIDYKLEIVDLTIPNPEIINVTKHEGESFGTITGVFYGYIKEIKSHDEPISVDECFGETGRTEEKQENGRKYSRKEYYNTDCTKYWGSWTTEFIKSTPQSTSKTRYSHTENYSTTNAGCFGSFGSVIGIGLSFLFFLFLLPKLAFLLPFILIPFLLNLLPIRFGNWVARIAVFLFGVLFLFALLSSIFFNKPRKNEQVVVKPKRAIVKPKYISVVDTDSNNKIIDTLIFHHMVWDDYNGKTYEGDFSIRKSVGNQAHLYKENLNISMDSEDNYDKVIFSLKENDKNNLSGLYSMFDSVRVGNRPNSMKFAEIIVSFVQTIPYTIVLPKSCDAQFYNDEFTTKYLANSDARCDGFERFGINSPVEFISYLNGDCDTRTLLLYTIFSHYNYDVALLSSSHYGHSILGINLPYQGRAFDYNNQRYVFWETTAQNAKPGIISNEVSDINYWRISLKSK